MNLRVCNLIRSRILMTGPITVAEYMKMALTQSSLCSEHRTTNGEGYYMQKDVIGKQGDFITSPEISSIFGEMLAVWGLETWMKIGGPKKISIVELGPGRGTLSKDILRVFHRFQHLVGNDISLHLVEISPFLANLQHQNLCQEQSRVFNTEELKEKIRESIDPNKAFRDGRKFYHKAFSKENYPIYWYRDIADVPSEFNFYIAHEFLDALPIHKLQKVGRGWREILIDIDKDQDANKAQVDNVKFRYVISRHETPTLALLRSRFPNIFTDKNHVEISVDAHQILDEITTRLDVHGGVALLVDYGHEGTKEDTFRGFFRHALHDPLVNPGTADLTADVDFSFIKSQFSRKAMICGPITQANFLNRTGINLRVEQLLEKCTRETEKQQIISCHKMLTDNMGDRFLFMAMLPKVLEKYSAKLKIVGFHE